MFRKIVCLIPLVIILMPLFSSQSFGQYTTMSNGVRHTTAINVVFRLDPVSMDRRDTLVYVSAIRPAYYKLREYLSSFGLVVLRKVFPGRIWGDTILVNPQGR